jgi:hypothetical protein
MFPTFNLSFFYSPLKKKKEKKKKKKKKNEKWHILCFDKKKIGHLLEETREYMPSIKLHLICLKILTKKQKTNLTIP